MKLTHGPVHHEVIALIKRAKQRLVLISPYFDLWRGLIADIERAATRGVKISVIARGGEDRERQEVALRRLAPCLHYVGYIDRLHAKIYLNEHEALITSMNLVESSAMNSVEIAVHIDGQYATKEYSQARRICDDLIQTAEQDEMRAAEADTRTRTKATPDARRRLRKDGFCIRCAETISFNAQSPLCEDCFKVWARYKNPEYEEEYCHQCGEEASTSMQDPLCEDCE